MLRASVARMHGGPRASEPASVSPLSLARLLALLTVGAASTAGCTEDAIARPQLIVVVDTDAPVVGQLTTSPDLAAAAAVDTVRVDLVRDDRDVVDFRDFTAPDPRDWPLSFGIASQPGAPALVRLRIRAFRQSRASRGLLNGSTTIEPAPSTTIDRLVEIQLPSSGVQTVRVTLASACIGAHPSFQPPLRTCLDDEHRDSSPSDGILTGAGTGSSVAGTSTLTRDVPCGSAPPEGATCIPGGFTTIGDDQLKGLLEIGIDSAPARPVHLSSFHMDTTEMTVGRYRKLLARRVVDEKPQVAVRGDLLRGYCTWLSVGDAANDAMPLNCVSYVAAQKACEASGGRLPTEAEWEYAARGRGLARRFSWGDERAECCSASVARRASATATECAGEGPEPVRSHAAPDECAGKADVSRDGIYDLGGSLSEATLDQGLSFRDSCWTGPGVVNNPRCKNSDFADGRFSRGGDWSSGTLLANLAFRRGSVMPSEIVGFRCVYDDAR